MSKNKILLISFTIFLLVLVGVSFIVPRRTTDNTSSLSPTPIPAPPTIINAQEKINVSGVEINDITANPIIDNGAGDVLFIQHPKYQVVYEEGFEVFIISILASPFEETRREAEDVFVEKLGITKQEACGLDVTIGSPSYAGVTGFDGKNRKLSFCP
ncbi:MAG: hypothetical protein WD992_01955 [Candidatus Levyibacteriota bacterium]